MSYSGTVDTSGRGGDADTQYAQGGSGTGGHINRCVPDKDRCVPNKDRGVPNKDRGVPNKVYDSSGHGGNASSNSGGDARGGDGKGGSITTHGY
ncbi:hypothetical protein NHJ13051_009960 [Beauveria bassiana]